MSLKVKVGVSHQIRNGSGKFGCPTCWKSHHTPLIPGTPSCHQCGSELEWDETSLDIWKRKTDGEP